MMRQLTLCILALAWTGAWGTGQKGPRSQKRQQTRCSVRMSDGSPWVKAEVLFVSRPIATHAELEGADIVRAMANERGVARARLLPGRTYSCWAQSRVDGSQAETLEIYRTSKVWEGIRAGEVARMKSTEEQGKRFRIRVEGLGEWKEKAPFTLRVTSTGPMNVFHEVVELDDKGGLLMPVMPGPVCFLQVFGKGMYPIHQEPVPISTATWKLARQYRLLLQKTRILEGLDPGAEGPTYLIPVPPPSTARVFVKDSTGKGIPEAQVFSDPNQARSPWYPVARTDQAGHASFPIAAYRRKDGTRFGLHLDILARAEGYADGWGIQEGVSFDKEAGMTELTLELGEGYSYQGKLWLTKDLALTHQELILFSSVKRGKNGGQIGIGPYRFRTKADGSFRLRGRTDGYGFRLCTQLSPEQIGKLSLSGKYPIAPLVWLTSNKEKDEAATDIRLDRYAAVDIQIQGRDGSPVSDAELHVGEIKDGAQAPHYPLRYRPNRFGRLRMLLRPGSSLALYVSSSQGAALQRVDVPKLEQGAIWKESITLTESVVVRGRVLDSKGSSVRDAFVRASRMTQGGQQSAFPVLNNWRTMTTLSNSTETGAYLGRERWPNRIWRSRQWRYHAHPGTAVACNAMGEFELWMPQAYKSVSLSAVRLSKGQWLKSPITKRVIAEATNEPLQLVIQD